MGLYWFLKTNQFTNAVKPRQQSRRLTANSAKTFQALHQNNRVLDKAGPNGIALVAGIKGSQLPHCGITTHEYYLAGVRSSMIGSQLPHCGITTHEYYLSDRLSEAHSLQLA